LNSISWSKLGESTIDNQKISIKSKDPRADAIDNSKELESNG